MIDIREALERETERFHQEPDAFERLLRGRDRKQRNRRVSAAVLAIVITLLGITGLMRAFQNAERPATVPTPTPVDTGMFSGMGGWIAYGDNSGIWAMDPEQSGPGIRLSTDPGEPLAWSSDGSKLLIMRRSKGIPSSVFGDELVVLNADGSETVLVHASHRRFLSGGSFSPDASSIVYAYSRRSASSSGIYVIDTNGGLPRRILASALRFFPSEDRSYETWLLEATFSPDGSQVAYIDGLGDWANSLRVMNADGSGTRVLLEGDDVIPAHVYHLVWSPDGRSLAFSSFRTNRIYVIGADGSELRVAFTFGQHPYWSPDGSRISYDETSGVSNRSGTLVIADADGTHVHRFDYGRSGPWNPLDRAGSDEIPRATSRGE